MATTDTQDIASLDLAHLGYQHGQPHPALSSWVQRYWIIRQQLDAGTGTRERLYPDGGTTLIFDLLPTAAQDGRFFATQTLSFFEFSGAIHSLGIRFHPGALTALFGLPAAELEGQGFWASELGIPGLADLSGRLIEQAHAGSQFALVDAWLLQLLDQRQAAPGIVQFLWNGITSRQQPVSDLMSDVGASRRKIERLFQHDVGVSPARLQLMVRLKQAREMIKTRPALSLTDIGLACGFYDQAHFIRQFQALTRLTPGQYRQRHQAKQHKKLS